MHDVINFCVNDEEEESQITTGGEDIRANLKALKAATYNKTIKATN